jgi:hypothetical protein
MSCAIAGLVTEKLTGKGKLAEQMTLEGKLAELMFVEGNLTRKTWNVVRDKNSI